MGSDAPKYNVTKKVSTPMHLIPHWIGKKSKNLLIQGVDIFPVAMCFKGCEGKKSYKNYTVKNARMSAIPR